MAEGLAGGGQLVPAEQVRVSDEAVPIGAPQPARSQARGEPKIQLVRDGGVIRAIEVICSCGELIRIKCEYS
jgi:hypothetical protein